MAEERVDTPYPGVQRRTYDTAQATIAEYAFAPRATFPLHRHPHEQIVIVRDGSVEMTMGRLVRTLGAGEWAAIAGNEEHGITARDRGASFLAVLVPRRMPDDDRMTLIDPDPGAPPR